MSRGIAAKILLAHLQAGSLTAGSPIALRVDSTLVHDMSGPLAFIGFEAMGLERVSVERPTAFLDHNLVAMDYRSPDDHQFVASAARKYGVMLSPAGNGICHSEYYHRVAKPGMLLAGADSHSATAGAVGMLGIGLGGLDVSVIMSGEPMKLLMPEILNVRLTGLLSPGSCAKDAALLLLGRLTIKGCVGKILEYTGEGVKTLSVAQRATIANMGAEMGATSSVFPADEQVKVFLEAQGRGWDYVELLPDADAVYESSIELDLAKVVPMAALPSMPDNVVPVKEAGHIAVQQVFIGSCANGSYMDLARAARVLRGRKVHSDVSLLVAPANRQILKLLLADGSIQSYLNAGARLLECGCGPCIGLGQAPPSRSTAVRTSNRNYPGRSGTADAQIILTGTETAAATAVLGRLASVDEVMDPKELDEISEPRQYPWDEEELKDYRGGNPEETLRWGPNLKPIPVKEPLKDTLSCRVSLKVGDHVTTDDILPPGPDALALRPNIPELSKYLFGNLDPHFYERAVAYKCSILVVGENYGQGSSREHAAIGPMYLGVQAVLAKSIARISRSNLINYGILPLIFENPQDYEQIDLGNSLETENLLRQAETGLVTFLNGENGKTIEARLQLSAWEKKVLYAGGLLPYIRSRRGKGGALDEFG